MDEQKKWIKVSPQIFSIIKAAKPVSNAWALVQDGKEITAIVERGSNEEKESLGAEAGWRLVTFDMELAFDMVGFLAQIANALAKEGISIFVISAYSTDHIFLKEKDLQKAVQVLESLGFFVRV